MEQSNASTPTREELIEAARSYVRRGWSVIQVHDVSAGRCSCGHDDCAMDKSAGKHPRGGRWQLRGLSAEQDVETAWMLTPQANVGILTGAPSGFWALDVDPKNGGDTALAELINAHGGEWVPTAGAFTGSGGSHYYLAMPDDFEPTNSSGRLPPGLDVRGTGGFVVAPPSVSGIGPYSGYAMGPIAPPPAWLLDLVRPLVHIPRQRPESHVEPSAASGNAYHSYALAGARAELSRLRAAPVGRRGRTAFEVACCLIELVNADWAKLDESDVHAAYDDAADEAMAQGGGFDQREADGAWRSAQRTVGAKARDIPALADIGGGARFDWSPPPGPFPTAVAETAAVTDISGLHLPEAFWAARPSLAHIRAAAHARCCSADVVLLATLARLAAMVSPECVLDVGAGPASLNLIVAPVGPSGTGKTQGAALARDLIPLLPYLDGGNFRDGLPLGSGEGVAESYMGTVTEKIQDLGDDGLTRLDKEGNIKMKSIRVRKQVRAHAFFVADEGEALLRTSERSGSTTLQILRSAWSGALLGQANAREETTRIIPAGAYSFGLVIGFQTASALPVLQDVNGLAQRVLWCSATDPSLTEAFVEHPGPLYVDLSWHPMAVGQTPWTGSLDFPPAVKAELRRRRVGRNNGTVTVPELDTHADLARAKVAALLALLENRRAVSEEDWELAGQIWATSAAVRDRLIDLGKEQAARAAEDRERAHVRLATRTQEALDERNGRVADASAQRIAYRITALVRETGSGVARGALRKRVVSRDRVYFDDALSLAEALGWLLESEGKVHPGHIKPPGG